LVGVPLVVVNPAWTSRTCPKCGDARAENRRDAWFHCGHCGYMNHADVVGATNLARRWLHEHAPQPWGSVNGPNERVIADHAKVWTDAQAADSIGGVDTPLPT